LGQALGRAEPELLAAEFFGENGRVMVFVRTGLPD
jgi:hypothetical protein